MATYSEGPLPLEFLFFELHPNYNRERVTIAAGTPAMKAGRVIGKITASGKCAHYNNAATDGTGAASGVLLYDADASAADVEAVVLFRGPAIVTADDLGWGANDSAGIAAGITDLAAMDIIARAS